MSDALVIFTPSGKRGRFPRGTPLLTAARQLGVDLDSVCGGRGICGRCQVAPQSGPFPKHGIHATPDALSPLNAVEARYADKRGLAPGHRLGCQACLQGDTLIDVPADSQVHRQVVRKAAATRPMEMDPATRLYLVDVPEPDMHDPSGDFERLARALEDQWNISGLQSDLKVLRDLQPALRRGGWRVTLAVHWGHRDPTPRLTALWPGFHAEGAFGLAIDLGSTTIAAHLTDLTDGSVRAAAGVMNPQIRFGEDLMSRVSYAMMTPGGADEMTVEVRAALRSLATDLAQEAGIDPRSILEAVVVCNPVMHHLFLGLDPTELGQAPFALATSGALEAPARDLGLTGIAPGARLYLLPCIAGHVGADAAAPGAIERVRIDPVTKTPRFRVIGCDLWSDDPAFSPDQPITGICGSGIIEAVAEMRMAGLVDASGLIGSAAQTGSDRCLPEGRTHSYLLHDARAAGGPRILVTQGDIRAIQLAKSALYAGARLLMDTFGVEHVDRVVLAGAFGAHISPLHALVLGMIPDVAPDRVTSAGNAAGTGARMALCSRAARAQIEALVHRIHKVETAIEPRFQEHFVAAATLPHATDPFATLRAITPLPEPAFNRAEGGPGRRRRTPA